MTAQQTIQPLAACLLAGAIWLAATSVAHARCDEIVLERFLADRVFTLSAESKIRLYDQRVFRYYGKRDQSRQQVFRAMRRWEERWPDRIYKFIRIRDYRETEAGDACRVTFDYKFIAYDPERDKTSAGIGRTSLVLAERNARGDLRIVGEWGDVTCRGLDKFRRGRC
ncbi:MAG: hypothetical protein AAF732_07605 [Pseudomonadota bacterium]